MLQVTNATGTEGPLLKGQVPKTVILRLLKILVEYEGVASTEITGRHSSTTTQWM